MTRQKEREQFAKALEWHVGEEQRILDEYRTFTSRLKGSSVSLLTDLILTDEDQHHALLQKMVKILREPAGGKTRDMLEDDNLEGLLQETRKLREHEKETVQVCRNLKSQMNLQEPEPFEAILDALIFDSEKHQRLLLAVEKTIKP
jgi:rubrerythrin